VVEGEDAKSKEKRKKLDEEDLVLPDFFDAPAAKPNTNTTTNTALKQSSTDSPMTTSAPRTSSGMLIPPQVRYAHCSPPARAQSTAHGGHIRTSRPNAITEDYSAYNTAKKASAIKKATQ